MKTRRLPLLEEREETRARRVFGAGTGGGE